jgi:hypothetical protein
MTCANPSCGAQTLYLRSGAIFAVDFPGSCGDAGECQIIQRRVIWLCDACIPHFAVETWRPPGEQVRPSRRILKAGGPDRKAAPPEAWN